VEEALSAVSAKGGVPASKEWAKQMSIALNAQKQSPPRATRQQT
jgi:hypothetical protein